MKISRKMKIAIAGALVTLSLCGCTESTRVSQNVSKEANNFNVTRRIAVINMRTDKPVFELVGNFALSNSSKNELEVIVEKDDGTYQKHFIYLNEYTMYVVEDLSGAEVDKYTYEISFLPETFQTFSITSND